MKRTLLKLKELKRFCSKHDMQCTNCIYKDIAGCIIKKITKELKGIPQDWNLEEVERLMKL